MGFVRLDGCVKTALVLGALFFLFGQVSAESYTFNDKKIWYGQSGDITPKCNANNPGECPADASLEVCGDTVPLQDNKQRFSPDYIYNVELSPSEHCSDGGKFLNGDRSMDLVDSSGNVLASATLKMRGGYIGKYLNLKANDYNGCLNDLVTPQVMQMHFTDSPTHGGFNGPNEGAHLLVNEDGGGNCDTQMTDNWAVYKSVVGQKVTPESSDFRAIIKNNDLDDACTSYNGGCTGRTDWVLKQTITESESNYREGCSGDIFAPGYWCFLNHDVTEDNNPWMPRGEIIVAYPSKSKIGKNFLKAYFMCDPASGNAGQRVYSSSQVWECQSGDWNIVAECGDSLDNDGDGFTDYPSDPSCDSSSDEPEDAPVPPDLCSSAPDAIVGYNDTIYEKVAFYDADSNGGFTDDRTGCKYNYQDKTPQSGNPPTFYCYKQDSKNNLWDSERNDFCKFGIPDNDFNEHGADKMLAIEYYIPKHAIPYGTEYASSFGDSDPDWGFNNDQHQSIHDAEEKYDTGDAFTCDGPCHDKSIWDNKNMTNTGGYSSPEDPNAIEDAWIESNATGEGTSGVQFSGTPYSYSGWVNESDVWSGGFAGDCEPGQIWQYIDADGNGVKGWQCSGNVEWPQEVYLPSMGSGESKAGFIIMPYNFYDFSPRSDVKSYNEETSNDAYLEKLEAKCWKGGFSTKYSNAGSNNRFSVTIDNLPQNPSVPVPVVGNMNHDGVYTCAWNYTDTDNDKFHKLGKLTQLSGSDYKSVLDSVPTIAGINPDYNDWSTNGQKLIGTVDSSTLGSVAETWKNALSISY